MLEIEVKYRADDHTRLNDLLARWGAQLVADRSDADHYLNAPHRDFARTDEALRIRRIGTASVVTYKGPKTDAQTKTRKEIEVPLADGDEPARQMREVFEALGFRPVAVVRKRRRVYELTRDGFSLEICLDDVENVGKYAEVEIIAPEADLDQARAVVLRTASELGLTESERRSYLELLLEKKGSST